jgi:very-short-patch-repair endonuclease
MTRIVMFAAGRVASEKILPCVITPKDLALTNAEVLKKYREKKPSQKTLLEDSLFEEFRFHGLPLPERQYFFHPVRKWRADFAWPDRKIIVEVQGGLFMRSKKGGHNRGAYMEKEYEKHNYAASAGWKVFKFGPKACYKPKRAAQWSLALEFLFPILKVSA